MYIATRDVHCQRAGALLVTDKRGRRPDSAQREGERWPIGELGSKALYQVRAERFVAGTPSK
jgi:hypothetical protein